MRAHQGCQETLEALEDEVDSLDQELEEKKREETKRHKKVATLQKEIQVWVHAATSHNSTPNTVYMYRIAGFFRGPIFSRIPNSSEFRKNFFHNR